MSKSRDAFRTISEVADWLETPAHVLRFWESKFTQVKPVKRAGGRRYYRPADMLLLGGIKKLLHDDGLTIKGAQKLLREHGVKHVASLSQPLEEDVVEEAGFIDVPEAPPEPKEPARVLNFRRREEEAAPDAPTEATPPADPVEEPAQVEDTEAADTVDASAEDDTDAPVVETEVAEDQSANPAPEETASAPEAPPAGFGGDTLPAFLRRGADKPAEPTAEPQPDAASAEPQPPAKVTIDPVARFVHTPTSADADAQETIATPEVDTPPSPQEAEPEAVASAAPVEQAAEPVADAPMDEPERPDLMADVPPAAKIAPELDTYSNEGGVLSALSGSSKISTDLAEELAPHLAELRALRDRMVGAGRS